MIRLHSWIFIFLPVCMALLLAACAGGPPVAPAGPAPDVRLGPRLDLLPLSVSHDHLDVLLDRQGNAHVFIAAAGTGEVHHMVVSPDGEVQRERVVTNRSPATISAAYDSRDRLHLLLDDAEWVREASGWQPEPDTPWAAAGIRVSRPVFVRGANGLIRAFLVDGKEVGAGGHWNWLLFGGYGAGIIIPWHTGSVKRVIVPEADLAEPLWYVIDPQDGTDTSNALFIADGRGNLQVVYTATGAVVYGNLNSREAGQARYAQISLKPPQPGSGQDTPASHANARQLEPVRGSAIPLFVPGTEDFQAESAAVDPESGTLLVARALHDDSFDLRHGQWSLPMRLPSSRLDDPRLAPAGGDAFHLLARDADSADVLYLYYTQDGWTAPLVLENAGGYRTGIASNGGSRAFAIWQTKTGIVGRWLEGPERRQSPLAASAESQHGDTPIPKDLQDFAQGKAELVTPGWVTGFPEAAAAGRHGVIAKQLHDSGQWITLARMVLQDNYGDDVRWYFLGRAAEGLGLCDAAETYYRISRQRSEKFMTRCLSVACVGFKLPGILEERFKAVAELRSAGKCLVPQR